MTSYGDSPIGVIHRGPEFHLVIEVPLKKFVVLQVEPPAFHQIKFWAVDRQIHGDQALDSPPLTMLSDCPTSVNAGLI